MSSTDEQIRAQSIPAGVCLLSDPQVKEALSREGVEVLDNWLGELYRYDLEAHERVARRDTAFGAYAEWDYQESDDLPEACAHPECTLNRPYINRLGGFVRESLLGPDEIGQILRDHNIWYTDAPGNGLLESLMICKKYGLTLHFECPVYNLPEPYTRRQLDEYREVYRRECRAMADWLRRLEGIYGQRLVHRPDQPWVVREKYAPLELFVRCCERSYEEINWEFREEHGADLPLGERPTDAAERALRIRFWHWIRRKHAEVLRIQAEVFREEVAGDGPLTSNIHLCPQPDWLQWGEIFDLPGVAARPGLLEDELVWKYYAGYVTRLVADLTQKLPLISMRYNLFAAGARVMATPSAIRYWFSECVRNGVTGFYHWIKDYSSRSDRTGYTGPCLGNPDPSTRGGERWRTFLDICKKVGETKVFVPPPAEVGIFVSLDSCAQDGWQRVLSAHIELRQAGLWHRFVSDALIDARRVCLDSFKLLLLPVGSFERKSVTAALTAFVRLGGTLVVTDPHALRYDLEGRSTREVRRELLGVVSLSPRSQDGEQVRFTSRHGGLVLHTWGATYEVEGAPGVEVTAQYSDGAVAAIERRMGGGKMIFLGAEISDVFTRNRSGARPDDAHRPRLLKRWADDAGAADRSWVWRVNLDNLQRVTGKFSVMPPPIDESIQFRSYMYEHSCLHIVPWLTEGQWSSKAGSTEEGDG